MVPPVKEALRPNQNREVGERRTLIQGEKGVGPIQDPIGKMTPVGGDGASTKVPQLPEKAFIGLFPLGIPSEVGAHDMLQPQAVPSTQVPADSELTDTAKMSRGLCGTMLITHLVGGGHKTDGKSSDPDNID